MSGGGTRIGPGLGPGVSGFGSRGSGGVSGSGFGAGVGLGVGVGNGEGRLYRLIGYTFQEVFFSDLVLCSGSELIFALSSY